MKLTDVDQAPEEAEPYRQTILLGLKMRQKDDEMANAAEAALSLLTYWTGEELAADQPEEKQLAAWQAWFAQKYPEQPEAALPKVAENAKHTVEELLSYLAGDEARGSSAKGAEIYVKAQCAKCHRFDDKGDSYGPDLSTISSRFTRKELLESIVFPSHVISSQYASKTVRTTDGRTISGLVVPGAAGETVIMQATGEKVTLTESEIDETRPSNVSAMPSGLLDPLTQEEIADLVAYLQRITASSSIARKPGGAASK
jgi:putative heme-binding domain-containing protein